MRGKTRHRCGRALARLLPRPDELRGGSLQAPPEDLAGRREAAPEGAGRLPADPGQRALAHPAQAAQGSRYRGQTLSARASGEHPLLHREKRPIAGALAAGSGAHSAQDQPVLLSAETDPGDERGLGHLLALHHPQSPV
ncbi:hypothetical protein D3C80_1696380 [compost metagenome]